MALVFIESFEGVATADLAERYSYASVGVSDGVGRYGTRAARPGNTTSLRVRVPNHDTYIFGFAFRMDSNTLTLDQNILRFQDSALSTHIYVSIRGNQNKITVVGPFGSYSSYDFEILAYVWYYLEFKATIHDSAGSYEIRINGITQQSYSGLDTKVGSNAGVDYIAIGVGTNGYYYYCDDIYICDDTGSTNNDFLGDVRIVALYPNAAGDQTDWTPSTGNNYDCVNDAQPNDDTDYVSTSTATNEDLYNIENITISGEILGVQVNARFRKDDAGSRKLKLAMKSDATTIYSSGYSVTDDYIYEEFVSDVDPDGDVAWTVAGLNALQIGANLVS